ncbi:PadR family transcriptional regulator [Gordonia sp. zg691]|uniref:PadR family transcriptional regulator n=1 Tax=Gordonia jinghuaiqii TaxID=2758710 RepID=A0A7D7R5K9_9ACTN|nr:PadR family transcriptional regulator [Gordonia jinghuaiqii]MBD0861763.1 PadR family transcriptional regulator [Gordonia jinghuaiqii]MCR5977656.1 PadR family transcriptional regulator [Gordonia jinghuaiqii]QMT03727.1 PadR family transcriptional regulator [Gordonia jinghuaiqii]
MLSFGEELTGNDLKKWADWSIGFFYWSPSVSQVYAELKKLEDQSLVVSRKVSDEGVRGRRVYGITDKGLEALRSWSRSADIDIPVLKDGVMLRMYMGHLQTPEELKRVVHAHIANLRAAAERAALHAEHSEAEPGWAFSQLSLRWAHRHYQSEIELAEELLGEIDAAAERFETIAERDERGLPIPKNPGVWRDLPAERGEPG